MPLPAIPARPPRLATLQAVRALAASMVVVVHLAGPTAFEHKVFDRSLLQPLWYPAMTGVDVFFVVSGFVMAVTAGGALLEGAPTTSLGRFAWRRASRVYPVYWVVTLAVLAAVVVVPGLREGGLAGTDLLASFLLLPQSGEPLLLVGWTLVHEMGFYAVFTLALVAARAGRWAARAVLVGWGAFVLVGHLALPDASSPWWRVATNPVNLEFLLGIAAGLLVLRHRGHGGALLTAGLALLVPAWIDLSVRGPLLRDATVGALVVGTGAALAVAGLARLERDGRLRVPALLARLGDASYALYLVHVPLVTLLAVVVSAVLPTPGGAAGVVLQLAVVLLVLAGCQVAGLLAHRVVEQPLLRGARALERRATRPRPGPVADPAQPVAERAELSGTASTLAT